MKRSYIKNKNYIFFGKESPFLAVFIHGLSGNPSDSYWGNIPRYLRNSFVLEEYDFLFVGYKTNKYPQLPSLYHSMREMERLPSVEMVTDLIATTLQNFIAKYKYKRLNILGHSMGGLIANELASKNGGGNRLNISSISLLSSPTTSPIASKILNLIYLFSNPHIKYLSENSNYLSLLSTIPLNIRCSVIASDGDPIVTCESPRSDILRRAIPGQHTWMRSVDSVQHLGYVEIEQWLHSCAKV